MYIHRVPSVHGRIDVRTRAQRHQHAHKAWTDQMPALVEAYLAWKHNVPSDDGNTAAPYIFHVDIVGIAGKPILFKIYHPWLLTHVTRFQMRCRYSTTS